MILAIVETPYSPREVQQGFRANTINRGRGTDRLTGKRNKLARLADGFSAYQATPAGKSNRNYGMANMHSKPDKIYCVLARTPRFGTTGQLLPVVRLPHVNPSA